MITAFCCCFFCLLRNSIIIDKKNLMYVNFVNEMAMCYKYTFYHRFDLFQHPCNKRETRHYSIEIQMMREAQDKE